MGAAIGLPLTALVLVGGVLFWWRDATPLIGRLIAVLERRYPAKGGTAVPAVATIPPHLEKLAAAEDGWGAADDARARLMELYEHYGDWDRVSTAFEAERQAAAASDLRIA